MGKPTEEDFDAIGQRWIDDAILSPPPQVPEILHHYTDAAGLLGMMQSRRIWLTDYRFLNDRTEFVHIQKLVGSLLNDRDERSGPDWRAAFHRKILTWQKRATPEDAFVFSCSAHRDDLSQWRGYASEGCGFTIGFSLESLINVSNTDGTDPAFSRVTYADDVQKTALDQALSELEWIIRCTKKLSDSELETAIEEAARVFDWVATNRGALHKHSSFASENEWRLVQYVPKDDDRVKIRARGRSLVPYIEIGGDDDLAVKAIGIGPGHINPEIIEAVKRLTRGRGAVEIYQADTPYRQN